MDYLDHYLRYSGSNEAPKEYHIWGAFSTLSNFIGPRVWTHMGGHLSFYPNLFTFLVGTPGMMKTTAMRQASSMVKLVPDIAHAPTSASKEALVELMKGDDSPCRRYYEFSGKKISYSHLAVFASEIVSLLNASGNPAGMIEFFTDLWDSTGTDYKQNFMKGKSVIPKPYLTMLACLTPSTLQALINTKVVSVGMSRRCLFVFAKRISEPKAFIEVTSEQQEAYDWCVAHAKRMETLAGEFIWTPEARAFYKSWYDSFKPKVESIESEVLRNFYMTKPEYVIKISMLLSLAQAEPKLIHEATLFERALGYITSVEQGASELFDSSGRNELAGVAAEIEKFLREKEGQKVPVQTVLNRFWKEVRNGDVREIQNILDHLKRCGKIQQDVHVGEKGSFPFVIYVK